MNHVVAELNAQNAIESGGVFTSERLTVQMRVNGAFQNIEQLRQVPHKGLGYGVLRFVAEFFREPDSFLGILALGLSMGQWLCLPMIAAGVGLWLWAHRKARPGVPPGEPRPRPT